MMTMMTMILINCTLTFLSNKFYAKLMQSREIPKTEYQLIGLEEASFHVVIITLGFQYLPLLHGFPFRQ